MTALTTSGSKIYIGGTTAADTQTEFEALSWTEVKEVESFGEFGDESNIVNFSAVGDARVRKLKGARDAGTLALVCARDMLDAGQIAMVAAEKTKNEYNIKVLIKDANATQDVDSVMYFRALVSSRRVNMGGNDDVTKIAFNLQINTDIVEVVLHAAP